MNMSVHATRRAQARGIRVSDVAVLLSASDREVPVGGGAVSVSLTRRRLSEVAGRDIPAQQAERLKGVAAVVDPASDTVLTVLHMHGAGGRRYRR